MDSSQSASSTLEQLAFNNTALQRLPVDASDQPGSRTVPGACFSRYCSFRPLLRPRFVPLSQSALSLLGLSVQDVSGDPLAPEYHLPTFPHSFFHKAEPLCECTHKFEWRIVVNIFFWDFGISIQYHSLTFLNGDGRKVLRFSIREFLCSEAMFALGIPTTRAASLVTSDLHVSRDPPNNGERVSECCSVVMRLAPSFIRFGSFQIFQGRDEFSGLQGPSAGRDDIRAQLLDYVIESFYLNLSFFREVMMWTSKLVAQWQCVGFCHGVLNTDNMSILGLTLDYGPFGFMERFDPDFVCNASDKRRHYSYQAQPAVCHWNLTHLAEVLGPELIVIIFFNAGADFTNTFRLLSRVPWPEKGDDERVTVGPVADLIVEQCASIEELKVANKPTMEDR
uniref:Selenoprotein O n=1 Tax=Fundulus heteroclitus TaxID=8078 RepID=A0A3Q2PRS0_FUNHE